MVPDAVAGGFAKGWVKQGLVAISDLELCFISIRENQARHSVLGNAFLVLFALYRREARADFDRKAFLEVVAEANIALWAFAIGNLLELFKEIVGVELDLDLIGLGGEDMEPSTIGRPLTNDRAVEVLSDVIKDNGRCRVQSFAGSAVEEVNCDLLVGVVVV